MTELPNPASKPNRKRWRILGGLVAALLLVSSSVAIPREAVSFVASAKPAAVEDLNVLMKHTDPRLLTVHNFSRLVSTPVDALSALPPGVVSTMHKVWSNPNDPTISPDEMRSYNQNVTRYVYARNVEIMTQVLDQFSVALRVVAPGAYIDTDYRELPNPLGLVYVHDVPVMSTSLVASLPMVGAVSKAIVLEPAMRVAEANVQNYALVEAVANSGNYEKITVIDSGVSNPYISVYKSSDATKNPPATSQGTIYCAHGTGVAGLVNSQHPVHTGGAKSASIYSIKIYDGTGASGGSDTCGKALTTTVDRAFQLAIAEANPILLLSSSSKGATAPIDDGSDPLSLALSEMATVYGIVPFLAAGNEGGNSGPGGQPNRAIKVPAGAWDVMTVGGASDYGLDSPTYDTPWYYSSYNQRGQGPPSLGGPPKPDIYAVAAHSDVYHTGTNSELTLLKNPTGFWFASGTSFAAPLAAAGVAIMESSRPPPVQWRAAQYKASYIAGASHTHPEAWADGGIPEFDYFAWRYDELNGIDYPSPGWGWGLMDAKTAAKSDHRHGTGDGHVDFWNTYPDSKMLHAVLAWGSTPGQADAPSVEMTFRCDGDSGQWAMSSNTLIYLQQRTPAVPAWESFHCWADIVAPWDVDWDLELAYADGTITA